ncbi:hypothetical protein B0H19DRAFT_1230031 [Mycena capillaripes]|nr:hypothetical protein B0H19DRAFT_1230031 [Mycena capillaripes]
MAMLFFWTLFLLHIGQTLGFEFVNVGPVTIGELVNVSWLTNATEDLSTLEGLVLELNGHPIGIVAYVGLVTNYFLFKLPEASVLPGEFVSDKFEILAAPSSSSSAPFISSSSPSSSATGSTLSPSDTLTAPSAHNKTITGLIVSFVISVLCLIAFLFLLRRQRAARLRAVEALESVNANRIDTFQQLPTPGSSSMRELKLASTVSLSSGKAARRQAHLAAQMNAIRTEMNQLASLDGTAVTHAPDSVPGTLSESSAHPEQVAALQARIRELEAQATSEFALGLSDEPPPGYRESILVLPSAIR